MNRAERRRREKLAKKAAKQSPSVQQGTPEPGLQHAINLAIQHHSQGDLDKAEEIYRQILQTDPNQHIALHMLGVAAHQRGDNQTGAELIGKSIAINPSIPDAHFNLGIVHEQLNQNDEAIESYKKAIALKSDYADAHNNLGVVLKNHYRLDEAITHFHHALGIRPDYIDAHNNLGIALKEQGKFEEAEQSFHKALDINPDYINALSNLGNVLRLQDRLEEARASYQKALDLQPDYADAHNNLGNTLKDMNRIEEAIASFRNAFTCNPAFIEAHDNLLQTEQYRNGNTTESLFTLHREWDQQYGIAFKDTWPDHVNTREKDRKIRLGFVSPDLGRHPVGYFIVRLLENLPSDDVDIIIYSDFIEDDLTQRIKAASDTWHFVRGWPDEKLAQAILDDQIDILIDLAGHSANNRLLAFARKPAPLQVSWAGYVGTTGLSAIDYLISDRYSTRPEEEQFYQEKVLRMPDGWLCYDPPGYAPPVGEPPYLKNGFITFGSFNNPAKINDEVIFVWARILGTVENARLLIKYKGYDSKTNTERLTTLFEEKGIDPSRLILEGRAPHADMLARYNDVDIALDPFPYSGGLTTYEALWMGVPVVTVPGETFASRHTLSHLMTLGLPELVAKSQADYVEICTRLAGDADKLIDLRCQLRDRMATSPLCDGEAFANHFSALMRGIWRDWCSG